MIILTGLFVAHKIVGNVPASNKIVGAVGFVGSEAADNVEA
jgi:hypothetical protein